MYVGRNNPGRKAGFLRDGFQFMLLQPSIKVLDSASSQCCLLELFKPGQDLLVCWPRAENTSAPESRC